jgi:polysaccharide chain length determinant protein (PEP-CTERM system associated)
VLPGKSYTPEELLHIVLRRKWLILVPFVVAALSTALVAHRLPKRYRSETVILVVPQRVPEEYVRSTVTARIEDRLSSLREQILSRSRLERVIQDFNLYEDLRATKVMEDVVESMRQDIDVKVERGDAFRVSYISAQPRTAQQVTERLASLFIDENLRDRAVQAQGTSQFLEAQLEEARRRLLEHERLLENYQRQYAGQLPAQAAGNLQAIQSAQFQLQSVTENINRDRDRRLVLERQIADLQVGADLGSPGPTSDPAAPVSTGQQLDAAQAKLTALQTRYTPEHPDVTAQKRVVRELEARFKAEMAQTPTTTPATRVSPAEALRQSRLRDLNAEMRNLDTQLARRQEQAKQLQGQIASYQGKVDAVPTREAELTSLNRDYETLKNAYTTLLSKREDSKIAVNLERNQIGEQFKVLDPARVPERPYSPNVMRIDLVGAAMGLGLGMFLVGFLEYRDTTFKTEDDVSQLLKLPVLALVPMMASERERRTRRRRTRLMALAIGVIIISTTTALALWKLQIL